MYTVAPYSTVLQALGELSSDLMQILAENFWYFEPTNIFFGMFEEQVFGPTVRVFESCFTFATRKPNYLPCFSLKSLKIESKRFECGKDKAYKTAKAFAAVSDSIKMSVKRRQILLSCRLHQMLATWA